MYFCVNFVIEWQTNMERYMFSNDLPQKNIKNTTYVYITYYTHS